MAADRTSYVVEASFTILHNAGPRYNRRVRIFIGRFHEKARAIDHAKRAQKEIRKILWVDDVEVEIETVWHLRSGQAAAQLVRDVYRFWGEPQGQSVPSREETTVA